MNKQPLSRVRVPLATVAATALWLAACPAAVAAPAANAARGTIDPESTAGLHLKILQVKRAYRRGDLSRSAAWSQFSWVYERGARLTKADRVTVLASQALLLQDAGFPVVAAVYAAQALKLADDPLQGELEPAWRLLRRASEKQPLQNLLEEVAAGINLKGKPAPAFGSDWRYFEANAASRRGAVQDAITAFAQVKATDHHFLPAKYQQAMMLLEEGRARESELALKTIVQPNLQTTSSLTEDSRRQITDYAYLALGRIYYEERRFEAAARMYRQVRKGSVSYYDALFEQGWAFFMGGYPMQALGALYAAESPFYREVFNPEAPLLRAMVHYFLCRYEDSRNAVADFLERYDPEVKQLADYLDRQRLDPESAYSLFENLVTGVSERSLGLPRSILRTAAERDSMLQVRDQYAAVLEEKSRLGAKGLFGDRAQADRSLELLERWADSLRKDIGRRYLAELQDMKKDFERMRAQAEFLYVELLMSEKDQLLGKELHASTKITKVAQKTQVGGWAEKTQSWKDIKNGEYWWDEVGFYVAPVNSMCTVSGAKSSGRP